jgi:uncharacterized repeat protein (TIGR03847 family)
MTHQVHAFEPPERFVAGTLGPPGERSFFLQASGGGRLVTVACEKVQVALLADKLEELLVEASRRFGIEVSPAGTTTDNEPLQVPLEEEFRVGTLGLAFDTDTATIVIEALAAPAPDEEDEEDRLLDEDQLPVDRDRLRVRLSPQATRVFIDRARRVVAAGRPPCPMCGQPIDPQGHLCPRNNGYRR